MINPIALEIFGLKIHWYGIAYTFGFIISYIIIKKFHKIKNLTNETFDDIFFWTMLNGIIGGRIFEIIFYNPTFYLNNPTQILAVWNGGMAIHGGITFVILTLIYQSKKHKLNPLELLDIFSIPAALALSIGRITNFINQELVGKITTSSLGIIFPKYDPNPRHPYQLYLSAKNLLTFLILTTIYKTKQTKPGTIFAIFLILFNIGRFALDTFKVPDVQIWILTQGQILSTIFTIIGIILLLKINSSKHSS